MYIFVHVPFHVNVHVHVHAGKPSDEHRGDNPFSFTKFVKRKESVKQVPIKIQFRLKK